MEEKLEINLDRLPESGEQLQGELSPSLYDLREEEGVAKTGLKYDLFIQRFETELLVRGSISTEFELTCSRTLHPFTKTIALPDYAVSLEIEAERIDLTEGLREDILILLPVYPTCEMGDEPASCQIEEKYLALDKESENGVEDQPAEKQDGRWSALDGLGGLNS